MARRLDKLTAAQQKTLPTVRDEWLAVGLATTTADRAAAEDGVRQAYAAAGLPAPSIVVWLQSPMAGAIGAAMLRSLPAQVGAQVWDQVGGQVGGQVRAQVWDQVGGQVGGQVRAQVRGQVRAQVWDQVRGQVGGQVRDQVGAQVGDQVRGQVRGQVGAQVWDQVGAQVGDQVRGQVWDQVGWDRVIWGQHDAGWLAFYDAFRRLGIEAAERLDGLAQVARSAGWWWPFNGAVVLTERPRYLRRDLEGRLHCEDGQALVYPDGWGIWAVHGVRVPQRVIEQPETITAEQVNVEPNAEIRRVMVDRMGAGKYLQQADARLLDDDPEWGKLWRLEQADDEPLVMVECVNSTLEPDGSWKTYWLRVPPEMRSARAALGWTFEVPERAYVLEQQS